jgi:hypothetical protein
MDNSATNSATNGTAASGAVHAVARLLVRPVNSPNLSDIREFALDGHNIAIGRSPSCDIVLEGDQLISRRHALLRYDGERYTIVDLGSSNGTFINDVEITEAYSLAEGDRILLGEHELVYSMTPASPNASLTGGRPEVISPGRGPAPKTEPHPAVLLPPTDQEHQTGGPAPLTDPEPAEPTIPKSDLVASDPSSAASADADPPTIELAAASVGELDAVREQVAQLMAAVEMLARHADEADRQVEQRRATIEEVRERLTGLINDLQRTTSDADDGEELSPLIRVLRQAADNPRHVDYMMQLADSSGEILAKLEARQARQQAPVETLNALVALRSWLYRLG